MFWAASNSLQTESSFWNIFNCSPVEISMRLRSLDGWVKSVHSQGSKPGHKTVLTLSLMYATWGKKPKEFVSFFFFCHFPWLACPSLFVHLNLTYDLSLIVVIILLIMAMTLNIPPFPSIAFRIAVFSEGGKFLEQSMQFHLDSGLASIDFLPETPPTHLLDFHNCHYCTPQELDPTHAVYKVWMGALYGTLEQLCGNQTCTVLIFKRNIEACQTIRNHELDPL